MGALEVLSSGGAWSGSGTKRGSAIHAGTAPAPPEGAASGSRAAAWAKASWLEEAPGVAASSYYYYYHYHHYYPYYYYYYYGAAFLLGGASGRVAVRGALAPRPGAPAARGLQLAV